MWALYSRQAVLLCHPRNWLPMSLSSDSTNFTYSTGFSCLKVHCAHAYKCTQCKLPMQNSLRKIFHISLPSLIYTTHSISRCRLTIPCHHPSISPLLPMSLQYKDLWLCLESFSDNWRGQAGERGRSKMTKGQHTPQSETCELWD